MEGPTANYLWDTGHVLALVSDHESSLAFWKTPWITVLELR